MKVQKQIDALAWQLKEGHITPEEFSAKVHIATLEFTFRTLGKANAQKTEIPSTSSPKKQIIEKSIIDQDEIDLDRLAELVVPKDLTLSGQALWYQQKLEEVSPTWQYVKYVYNQVGSAWIILHGRKHEIERKLLEVKVLNPTKGKGNGKKRKPKVSKSFADQINALPISNEEKVKLAKLINVEL